MTNKELEQGQLSMSQILQSQVAAKIADAVAAERERCAKIAENFRFKSVFGLCAQIAKRIRSGQ